MTVRERLYQLVKTEMRETGVKQLYIAKRCGYTPNDFSAVLNGYKTLRSDDIEKICSGMGVSPNMLFGWDD